MFKDSDLNLKTWLNVPVPKRPDDDGVKNESQVQIKRNDYDRPIKDEDFFSTFDLRVESLAKKAEQTIRELKHHHS